MSSAPDPLGAPPSTVAATTKQQRPAVPVGAGLMVLGGVLLAVGSLLTWFVVQGDRYTGFSSVGGDTNDGPVFMFFGVVAVGCGAALLAARRVRAVVIVALVFSVPSVLAAFADLNDVDDLVRRADRLGYDASQGPGLWVILVGALVSVAGGVAALAKTRD